MAHPSKDYVKFILNVEYMGVEISLIEKLSNFYLTCKLIN